MTWARPSIFRSSVTGDGGQFCQAMGVAARKAEGGERLTRRCNLNLKVRWNVGNWRAPLLRRQRVFVLRFRRLPWTPSVATPRRAWGSCFFGGPARQPSPSMAASAAHVTAAIRIFARTDRPQDIPRYVDSYRLFKRAGPWAICAASSPVPQSDKSDRIRRAAIIFPP